VTLVGSAVGSPQARPPRGGLIGQGRDPGLVPATVAAAVELDLCGGEVSARRVAQALSNPDFEPVSPETQPTEVPVVSW
jgi:hypothetical protein